MADRNRPHTPLPATTHVGAVRLQIADLSRSIAYYTSIVGLQLIDRGDHAATLGPHGTSTGLVILHEKKGIHRAPSRGAYGLYHFAILLPDRPSLARFVQHIANANVRVGMADHLVSEAIYLTDPDGLGIEVYSDRPRSGWIYNEGELAMPTEPLDVADLIAAADHLSWNGVPAGTTMGHIHLHVGGLADADAFYHAALGFDRTVWSYPGALFMSAGGYHHHLATNTWSPGPSATDQQARLQEWELIVPSNEDAAAIGTRIASAGFESRETERGWLAADPWGTRVRITAE
jgi:catechol 2,3-dioxygenase